MTALGRMLPAVRFRNLAQQQADGAMCVSASPTPRATRPRDADILRRLRIRSRHHRKRAITDGIVNTRPDVGGLDRRPSPRVHDGRNRHVAYAEFNESLRFVHSGDLERSHLDLVTVREQSLINLRRRTQDWRATGGHDRVVVICADGNLEPSLILLNEVWDDPRVWVDGARLATIAERGFSITAGATNIFHVWQLAADAADSFAKAQYPVARQVFERRGERFELLDDGAVDEAHPIFDPDNLDIHAIKRGGGSDLTLLIESPLAPDARSVYRLFQKVDGYLRFIHAKSNQEQCGPPSPDSTQLVVKIHAASDDAVFKLLAAAGDWVRGRGASLVVERLRVQ